MSRLHANTSIPDVYWRKWLNQWAHLELCQKPRNPDIINRVLNQMVLSNSTVGNWAHMHVKKTNRTWENLDIWETKIILLSDELRIIANFKSFVNGSKSITRNNLGLSEHFEIYLFSTFKNIVIDLMVNKYSFGKERCIK